MGRNRKRTRKLWNQDPHCHWCGRITRLAGSGEVAHDDELATYDHLYTRFQVKRNGPHGYIGVLACRKCNWERGRADFLKAFQLLGGC